MFNKNKKPFSLRARFLMATAGVILALSLSYGLVAVVGYIVSFDKTAFRLLRGESNLFFSLAQWKDNKLTIAIPPDIDLNFPTLVFIYDDKGNLLWSQRKVPELEKLINKEWLEESGFYEIDTDTRVSSEVLGDNPKAQDQLKNYDDTDQNALTHSVAVLQSTLRSLRSGKQTTIEEAEPIMLDQIGRISQQIGYYLHRASINSGQTVLTREIHSVPALLDSLVVALNKVYQRKGVVITLDISPEVTFMGEKNDFMEVMGNVLENACKYCLEFVEITSLHSEKNLTIVIDDDGPGIPESKRQLIFQRGQRVDTLRPGQGLGLSVAAEIIEQYDGEIVISDSPLGGARMQVTFARQHDTHHNE